MSTILHPPHFSRPRYRPEPPLGLFITGQTTPYVGEDDGKLQTGYYQETRYRIVDADVFEDLQTGLYWPRDWTGDGWSHELSWTTALGAFLFERNSPPGFAGHADWRIPNIDEAHSLISYDTESGPPMIWPDAPWEETFDVVAIWSSTTYRLDTTHALFQNLRNGKIVDIVKTDVGISATVCRGGIL